MPTPRPLPTSAAASTASPWPSNWRQPESESSPRPRSPPVSISASSFSPASPRTALPRQQTLEASVDWSHDLLTELEQTVFRRLSVFAGDFDYDAAVAVCAAPPIAPNQVLDQLSLLVDKSLVLVDDSGEHARYRLLETVRAYASRHLAHAGEEVAARTAHRDHYLAVAEAAKPNLEGTSQDEWITLLSVDYPNLRAALGWSRDHNDLEALARMASALAVYWGSHGPNKEGTSWLDVAVVHRESYPAGLQAQVLFARMWLAATDWDPGTIFSWAEEGIRLARLIEDDRLLARIQICLGMANVLALQPSPVLEEALALARRIHDGWGLCAGLWALGGSYSNIDPAKAQPCYEEAISVGEPVGNHTIVDNSRANLGGVLAKLGQLDRARAVLEETLVRVEQTGDGFTRCATLAYLGFVLSEADHRSETLAVTDRLAAASQEAGIGFFDAFVSSLRGGVATADGDIPTALRMSRDAAASAIPLTRGANLSILIEAELAAALIDNAGRHIDEMIAAHNDARYSLPQALTLKARLCRLTADVAASEAAARQALEISGSMSTMPRTVDAVEVLAGVAADLGSHQEAARLFGAARRMRDETGYRRCVSERDADLDNLRTTLGDDAFQEAYEEGRSLSLDDAIAYARRGRGERKRPETGWASLTPAEIRVAELVKDGLSNADIGRRLLCSARTVQAHLTHIYAKLGITSRAELAAQTTQQQT